MEKIYIGITFDTTGSMYPCLAQVRRNIVNTVNRLFSDIPNLMISIIAHGDYCDAKKPYTIKMLDFTDDRSRIVDFVKNVEPTSGGDADECYELVLNQARTQLSWEGGSKKILMVVGDANPHGVNYPDNKNHIDWKNECKLLNDMNVKIYSVHCMSGIRSSSSPFYKGMAQMTSGAYLTLDQFSDITNLIMASCYLQESEEDLNEFVTIIRNNGQLSPNLQRNINNLTGKVIITSNPVSIQPNGLLAVPGGRFQVMFVPDDSSIKEFVEENGVTFQRGRAFYQLTKSETVNQYKELILRDKLTGEFFNGSQVRDTLGLLPQVGSGGVKEKLRPVHLDKYDVFIQSTSSNRKLIGGTSILYEVPDWDI